MEFIISIRLKGDEMKTEEKVLKCNINLFHLLDEQHVLWYCVAE